MDDLLTSEELLLEDPDEGDLFRAELEKEEWFVTGTGA